MDEQDGNGQGPVPDHFKTQIVITLFANGKINIHRPKNKELTLGLLANALVTVGMAKEEKPLVEIPGIGAVKSPIKLH